MTDRLRLKLTVSIVALYLAAIAAANLIITHYVKADHPEVSVYTALALIAFDLVARDLLHDWYRGRARVIVLAGLIVAGSLIAWLANPDSADVAKWSALAFACAMLVDTAVYTALERLAWLQRSTWSNAAAAAVDSVVFCAGMGFPFVVGFGQFTAKVAGGVLIASLLASRLPVARRQRIQLLEVEVNQAGSVPAGAALGEITVDQPSRIRLIAGQPPSRQVRRRAIRDSPQA